MVTKEQRRRTLAREKWERQQRRRHERRQRTRRRSVIAGAVVLTLAVIGGGLWLTGGWWADDDSPSAAAEPTTSPEPTTDTTPNAEEEEAAPSGGAPSPTAPGECIYVEARGEDEKWFGLPNAKVDTSVPFKDFSIKTNRGVISGELFNETTPCAVNSFEHLVANDAFADTTCTELATDPSAAHYLGCGDLTGSGLGGPGYVYATENKGNREKFEAGLLVLLDGADRSSSRFAITYGEPQELGNIGTVFGSVTNGLDIVEDVAKAGTDDVTVTEGIGRPKKALVFEDVTITG